MFVHWGLYAIPSRGEWVRGHERMSDEAYHSLLRLFNPVDYNPREWAAIAREAGMRYVVLTAKHHDGFCLFDSRHTDWKSTNTPARRDLIAEYAAACRDAGLKVGLYYSLLDWNHPHYPIDHLHPLRENAEAKARPRDLSVYQDYLHAQVRELLTNYGEISLLWLDFSYGEMSGAVWRAEELVGMIRQLQPGLMLNNRLVAGHTQINEPPRYGDFATPEQTIPPVQPRLADGTPAVWESCITLNDHWGFDRSDLRYKSPTDCVRMLIDCVSKGGNLLLNVGPNARGVIPAPSREILSRVGQWLRLNGEAIYGCTSADQPRPAWGAYTAGNGCLYAHITHHPCGPIGLPGLAGKIRHATLLADGSDVSLARPWMVGDNTTDAFLTLPHTALRNTACEVDIPVVRLELA